MSETTLTIFLILSVSVIVVLSLSIMYLLYVYRKLLDKYTNDFVKEDRSELHRKIKLDVDSFISKKTDHELEIATQKAVDLITKNSETIAKSIREKSLEKLSEEEKGQERAVSSEFDEAKLEIEKYKTQKYEEIKTKANEVLVKVVGDVLQTGLDKKSQEALVTEAIENAKRSNIF